MDRKYRWRASRRAWHVARALTRLIAQRSILSLDGHTNNSKSSESPLFPVKQAAKVLPLQSSSCIWLNQGASDSVSVANQAHWKKIIRTDHTYCLNLDLHLNLCDVRKNKNGVQREARISFADIALLGSTSPIPCIIEKQPLLTTSLLQRRNHASPRPAPDCGVPLTSEQTRQCSIAGARRHDGPYPPCAARSVNPSAYKGTNGSNVISIRIPCQFTYAIQ